MPSASQGETAEISVLTRLTISITSELQNHSDARLEALGLTSKQLDMFDKAGKACGDDKCLVDGVPTGAVTT
ncbi:hypothetical protein T484DRAFT_1805192 [Baffinella frigidus]|nr:hypothetical protein T484DRAFT_1805192 [Cryptophyta sp. CCMP2293]